jgi:hypothetical protein
VLFGALALFLVMGGAVGELIYTTGNVDLSEYSRLLAVDRLPAAPRSEGKLSTEPTDV